MGLKSRCPPRAGSLATMPAPQLRRKIVKKRTKKFKRFQSDRFMRVGESWRRPKGIDCRVRRKFKGAPLMPNIGYGSDKKTRHMLPNGFFKFHVKSPADIEMLLMHNGVYAAEIAGKTSAKKRREILARADQLNVKVINRKARLSTEENE